ncbi:MAG: TRAP transporter small permease subunit [Rhodospirillales bacterium]
MTAFSVKLGQWVSLLFLFSIVISAYEVVVRYVLNAPTTWVHEMTILMSAVAFTVSGLYSLAKGDEIRVTVISERFPRWLETLRVWVTFVMAAFFLGAVAYGGAAAGWEALTGWYTTRTAFDSPTPAILKPLLVVVSALMLLQMALRFFPSRDR